MEDTAWVASCQAGDQAACGALLEKYKERLWRLAYRLSGDADAAQDIVQETFFKALKGIQSFRREEPFAPWLLGICSHQAIDYLRQRGRRREASLDAPAGEEGDLKFQVAGSGPGPEEAAAAHELAQTVRAAVLSLPPPLRLVIVLRHYEDLSYAEIARVTGLSLAAVKTRIFRGREILATKLAALHVRGERGGERDEV
ncbi:MAG TPA: sigma-70 family RNA polymerase sigma factor [Firmicutes bacterium]|nr:sigma-70 family RNA polymerase sigma factor [Bacillota bacterium]